MNYDFYLSNNNLSETINLIENKLDFSNSINIKYDNKHKYRWNVFNN